MKIISRYGDCLAKYSACFNIPLPLLEDSNPHAPAVLPDGVKIKIPGYQLIKEHLAEAVTEAAPWCGLHPDNFKLCNEKTEDYVPVRIQSPLFKAEKFYDYSALLEDLKILAEAYSFIDVQSIGQSVLGKDIMEVRFGRGQQSVHYNGSFHANEWITSAVLMKWLNELLKAMNNEEALAGIKCLPLYKKVLVSIVPMVNPDGVDLVLHGMEAAEGKTDVLDMNGGETNFFNWKANINGVDLNNQYPANWEIEKERKRPKQPAPRDYPGDYPLSEPEAMALQTLAQSRNFDRVLALHTQGREFYWGYGGFEPKEAFILAKEFEEKSGYKAVRNIDSHAGFKDWFIQEFKKPGFTIELGKGINPLPLSMMPSIYKETLPLLMAGLNKGC
ncbi:M14 family metallopeptidase [Bacillus massiliglaciei]|uniref:M14 family metallopeptidase n=1 Tax=Bacillus massiliglaciei TaxID=1816693 RepID=UPI000AD3C4B9|nr:M14 family metallocarboxypeptidase [Bacillus massiliglaciei]